MELVDAKGNRLKTSGHPGTQSWTPLPEFVVIEPGESEQFLLSAELRAGGELWMETYSGGWHIWHLAAGELSVRATAGTIFAKEVSDGKEAAHAQQPNIWRGMSRSSLVKVTVDEDVLVARGTAPIRVTLSTPDLKKTHYGAAELIPVHVTKQNVGDAPMTVWHCGFWPNHKLIAKKADGTAVPLTERGKQCYGVFGPDTPRRKNVPYVLKPEQIERAGPYNLRDYFDIKPNSTLHIRCLYLHASDGIFQRVWSNDLILTVGGID